MIRSDRLKALLAARNKSQAELARAIGVSPQAVSKMVSGETTDTPKLYQIARFLGTTPEYLSGESDQDAPSTLSDRRQPFTGAPLERKPDTVDIAYIDLRFGLGGAIMDQEIVENQAELMSFPLAWLRIFTESPPSQLYWARGQGDSMEPKIRDGALILIDRSQISGGFGDLIWAISYGQTGMIKRLRPMPDGSLKILSDNPSVPPEIAYDGEVHIFGRVVAVVNGL